MQPKQKSANKKMFINPNKTLYPVNHDSPFCPTQAWQNLFIGAEYFLKTSIFLSSKIIMYYYFPSEIYVITFYSIHLTTDTKRINDT